MSDGEAARLDKWLWHARFLRTRTSATTLCNAGRVRVNGVIVGKAHHAVSPGDVLTFAVGQRVRVIRVLANAPRRGPASEAAHLYEDLAEPDRQDPAEPQPVAERPPGEGRPTKAERRALERLRGR